MVLSPIGVSCNWDAVICDLNTQVHRARPYVIVAAVWWAVGFVARKTGRVSLGQNIHQMLKLALGAMAALFLQSQVRKS